MKHQFMDLAVEERRNKYDLIEEFRMYEGAVYVMNNNRWIICKEFNCQGYCGSFIKVGKTWIYELQ